MLERMETGEQTRQEEQREIREKIEIALSRLHELKERVAELKRKCEELRQMETHRLEKAVRCNKCGHALDPKDQVVIKDTNGSERRHYHRECFQRFFR